MSEKRDLLRALPVTGRNIPKDEIPFTYAAQFLEELTPRTERTYRIGLRVLADWLQGLHDEYAEDDVWPLSLDPLTTTTVLDFRAWLLNNRSKATASTYLAAVTGFLYYLDGRDELPEGVELGKLAGQLRRRSSVPSRSETVASHDEDRQWLIPAIVHYFNDLPLPPENDAYNRRLTILRDRALVHTLYSTAARLSEVLSLDRSSVGHGRSKRAIITGKGDKQRTIHLLDNARRAIRAYLGERALLGDRAAPLFVSFSRRSSGSRLSTTAAYLVIRNAVVAIVGKEEAKDIHLSPHDFRHFRATQLLRDEVPLEVIQELLGHADISTTRSVYAPVLGAQKIQEHLEEAARHDPIITQLK